MRPAEKDAAKSAAPSPYRNFADFYLRSDYGRFPQLHAASLATRLGGFLVDQGAHDFTDAPCQDFILGIPLVMGCQVGFHMGDGWRRAQRRRGDLMLVPPGLEVAYRVDGPCRLLVLTWPAGSVRALDAERFLAEASLFSALYGRFFRSEILLDLTQRIFRALNTGGQPARLLLDGALATLVGLLAEHAGGAARRREPALRIAPARLRRATDLIEASLDRDLDLAEIAAAAGLSPYHFSRVFKAATGSSPYRYLTERRIERARTLLHGGNATIAEVAAEVGFSSQSRFTQAFRQLVGVTPGAWRRQSRGAARPVEPSAAAS